VSILAIYNIKGGVGKTTAAVNLSYLSTQTHGPTLLCDFDPQGSSSYAFRIEPSKSLNARKLLQGGKHIQRNIKSTDYPGLDFLPASFSYRKLDPALSAKKRPKHRFEEILLPLRAQYANIFLDCPPSITLESENVFHAAELILVPFIPTPLSLVTYERLMRFLAGKKKGNGAKVLVFFSMVDRRKKLHRQMVEELRGGDRNFVDVQIPYSSEIERVGLLREPIVASHPRSRGSLAFHSLWTAVQDRLT